MRLCSAGSSASSCTTSALAQRLIPTIPRKIRTSHRSASRRSPPLRKLQWEDVRDEQSGRSTRRRNTAERPHLALYLSRTPHALDQWLRLFVSHGDWTGHLVSLVVLDPGS